LEGIVECLKGRKIDGFFAIVKVPVIAFSALIVVAQNALTVHNEGQSIT
jgi:hypothetical protein